MNVDDRQTFVTEIATKHGKRLRRYLAARERFTSVLGEVDPLSGRHHGVSRFTDATHGEAERLFAMEDVHQKHDAFFYFVASGAKSDLPITVSHGAVLSLQPVFYRQSRHPAEFTFVVGYDSGINVSCVCGDERIVGPNSSPLRQ